MPYKIENIELAANDSRTGFVPGDKVSFTVAVKAEARRLATHCFHIELYDADNKICPWFTHNVMAGKGRYRGELPLALNAKSGTWRLMVREVISGITADTRFEVK